MEEWETLRSCLILRPKTRTQLLIDSNRYFVQGDKTCCHDIKDIWMNFPFLLSCKGLTNPRKQTQNLLHSWNSIRRDRIMIDKALIRVFYEPELVDAWRSFHNFCSWLVLVSWSPNWPNFSQIFREGVWMI